MQAALITIEIWRYIAVSRATNKMWVLTQEITDGEATHDIEAYEHIDNLDNFTLDPPTDEELRMIGVPEGFRLVSTELLEERHELLPDARADILELIDALRLRIARCVHAATFSRDEVLEWYRHRTLPDSIRQYYCEAVLDVSLDLKATYGDDLELATGDLEQYIEMQLLDDTVDRAIEEWLEQLRRTLEVSMGDPIESVEALFDQLDRSHHQSNAADWAKEGF